MHDFSAAPTLTAPRGVFDLSNGHKFTIDFDYIYPFYDEEVYPGDTLTVTPHMFGRLATPLFPVMDNMFLDIHFFSIAMRQLWTNSRKFFGEQENPGDSTDYTVPQMVAPPTTGYGELSLADYFDYPTKVPDYEHIALYIRGYNHIYNEWFRDQNLIDSIVWSDGDGPDTTTPKDLLKRGKKHDYFTSGLVSPQKSDTGAVDLPLGTTAPITGLGAQNQTYGTVNINVYEAGGTGTVQYANSREFDGSGGSSYSQYLEEDPDNPGFPNLKVDLSNATASTIIQLRTSMMMQALLELDARAGTRYPEIVYANFGVDFPDLTYRPEFLGGTSVPIGVNPVHSTYDDGTNNTKGALGGVGTVSVNGGGFTKSFVEHGIVIGVVSARADLTYSQGLNRKHSRKTRFDYMYPILQHVGDQATLTKEIYMQDPTQDTGSTGTPDNERVFNYQERYAELKYGKHKITGLFRPNATQSLEAYHLSEELGSVPTFDQTFIEQNTPIDRAIVVPSQPHLIIDSYTEVRAARPMDVHSIPGLGSRF